jgi:predicted nucleic acid-binding protein
LKHLFLDTNIVLDLLGNREPHHLPAAQLFEYAERGDVTLYLSALSYNNLYYILKKSLATRDLVQVLSQLQGLTRTLSMTDSMIESALASKFSDFEDALQYVAAQSDPTIQAIVIRDRKGFKHSKIAVLSAEEAVAFVRTPS